MSNARFCLVMPFFNEAVNLPATLASLATQTVERARLRLIAVDNGSDDGGAALVTAWLAATGIEGTLVTVALRSIPHALNGGIALAGSDDIVVRIDAHVIYGRQYLATIERSFDELPADVWCVGGAPVPQPQAGFLRALPVALYSNPLGLGPADFRSRELRPRPVSTVYLGAWRPGVLQRLGGFDERWLANEDCELSERIAAAGGRVYRVPVECRRITTRGPLATIGQWSRYGFWRAQTLKRYPRAIRMRHVVPPLVLVSALTLLCSPLRRWLIAGYGLYAGATILGRQRPERPLVTAASLLFFPLVQTGYTLGLLLGTVRSPASLRRVERRDATGPAGAGFENANARSEVPPCVSGDLD